MLQPEMLETFFYCYGKNLLKRPFKNYLNKINDYCFLETQSFFKNLGQKFEISELKTLQVIDLKHFGLTSIPNLNLPNLQILNLSHNSLKKIGLYEKYLPNLKYIYLDYNILEEIDYKLFYKLELVSLENNNFTAEYINILLPILNYYNTSCY